ncbi:MAG: leucine-rich repeat protein [Clostridia bacterium]|nr:leucine-rich repeat protein [Clostridia bacterium]
MKRFLKSSLSLILAITIIFSSAYVGLSEVDFSGLFAIKAEAASSGYCGSNLTWTLDDEGTLTISGTGDMYGYDSMDDCGAPWEYSDVYNVVVSEGVTSIGEFAFYDCTTLSSVIVSDTVTAIGLYAFKNCENLTSINLPDSVKYIGVGAFDFTGYSMDDNNWVKNVLYIDNHLIKADKCLSGVCEVKEDTKTIAGKAFYQCSDLTSLTIPYGVALIGDSTFAGCTSLVSVTIPDSVKTIGDNAFENCKSLTSIVIPDSVKSIGSKAFSGCGSLQAITMGKGLTHVYMDAFIYSSPDLVYINDLKAWCDIRFGSRCANPLWCGGDIYINNELVTDITIPDGVTAIKDYAFYCCKQLTSIKIPNSVASIGESSFCDCSNLKKINIPDSITSIGRLAFAGCDSLATIALGNNVKVIEEKAFYECDGLESIIIPNNVTFLGEEAFAYCDKLVAVTIGDGVKRIQRYTFESCDNLVVVIIGNNVTSIGEFAFGFCSNLEAISVSNSVTSISNYAFSNANKLNHIFYSGTISDWKKISIGYYGNQVVDTVKFHFNAREPYCEWVDVTPTCEKNGSQCIKCALCGGVFSQTIIPAKGHTPTDWLTDKSATVNAAGSQHKECTTCGEVLETEVIPQLKPATPKLSKVANTGSGVKVTWGAVEGADDYIVYRKTYNAKTKKWSGWSNIAKGVTSTSYVDKTAKSGTYYIYTVKANNEAGYGGHTSGLKIYFLSYPKATATNADAGVTVKWAKAAGATGYIVYRKTGSGSWQKIATVKGATKVSYTDKTAKAGVTYKYTVKAYYGSYTSAYNTSGVELRRLTTPKLAKVVSAKNGITFTWGKVAGASGYIVYRKTGKGSWQKIATVKGASTVKYLDKTAKKGTTYTYTVRAYYGSSNSAYNTKGLAIKDKY